MATTVSVIRVYISVHKEHELGTSPFCDPSGLVETRILRSNMEMTRKFSFCPRHQKKNQSCLQQEEESSWIEYRPAYVPNSSVCPRT